MVTPRLIIAATYPALSILHFVDETALMLARHETPLNPTSRKMGDLARQLAGPPLGTCTDIMTSRPSTCVKECAVFSGIKM